MAVHSLVQFEQEGNRHVAALDRDGVARRLIETSTVLEMAQDALAEGATLAALATKRLGEIIDLSAVRLLCPVDHPDPAHLHATGTGLTHLGSAEGRDKMHKAAASGAATDSMRMFLMGEEGGRAPLGTVGAQPEWFYKCDGTMLVNPGEQLIKPGFAGDGGDEPEVAGIYVIDAEGNPCRLGYALANEFSDHVTERVNYLWLAHSKLRQAAIGPELLLGDLPADVRGTVKILRNGEVLWEKEFHSGEANMTHTIANLEHHHFKNQQFRRPGDLHVHFFGTATLSFSDGIETREGDVFEISAEPFNLPLINPLSCEAEHRCVTVRAL